MGPTTGQGLVYEPIRHNEQKIMPINYLVTYHIGRNYLPSWAAVT